MKTIDYYRLELYRIALRMQYRVKRDLKREVSTVSCPELVEPSFSEETDNKLVIKEYLEGLSSDGKKDHI